MSNIAIYGDAHITRKMGNIQTHWNESVVSTFENIYQSFTNDGVESAICLGDLFDKAVLEAKSVKLVLQILSIINAAPFPTYVLLGNHEIDSNENNILEYLSEYNNIFPITTLKDINNQFTFIPYSQDISEVPENMIRDHYVFTHHDIYGSLLAGGLVKASFGIDPELLSSAKLVFNGHVHLHSKFGNIINVGSITKMQQGELKEFEKPVYYYLNTEDGSLNQFELEKNFIAPLSIYPKELSNILRHYDESVKFLLRLKYDIDEDIETLEEFKNNPRILSLSLRKNLKNNLEQSKEIRRVTLDIKEFLADYIRKDMNIKDAEKEDMISTGISLLGD